MKIQFEFSFYLLSWGQYCSRMKHLYIVHFSLKCLLFGKGSSSTGLKDTVVGRGTLAKYRLMV